MLDHRSTRPTFQHPDNDSNIHADPEADALNRGVAAMAFTVGSDIFFRAGAYQPQTPAGQHLLAHELTHVVQQRTGSLGSSGDTGGNAGGTMTVGAADDRHEQEAEQTAQTTQQVAWQPVCWAGSLGSSPGRWPTCWSGY